MSMRGRAGAQAIEEHDVAEAEEAGPRFLTRDDILGVDDIGWEDVEVPEWGGTVRIRALTGTERDAYDAEGYRMTQAGSTSLDDFRVRRVARCIVGPDMRRLFTDADIARLGAKNGAVIDRLDDVVARLSGLDAGAERRAVRALKAVPSDASGSGSPPSSDAPSETPSDG